MAMLQQDKPKDYVIATGKQYMQEFINAVCEKLNMPITWEGTGKEEKGINKKGQCIVRVDPKYYRPCEVDTLLGDATLAHKELGWKPKTTFFQLIDEMVDCDLKLAKKEKLMS